MPDGWMSGVVMVIVDGGGGGGDGVVRPGWFAVSGGAGDDGVRARDGGSGQRRRTMNGARGVPMLTVAG